MAGPTITPTNRYPRLGPAETSRRLRMLGVGRGVAAAPAPRYSTVERWIAVGVFGLLIAFYVALPSLKFAGMPMRGLMAVSIMVVLSVAYPAAAETALRKYMPLLGVALVLALLGTFASMVNGAPIEVIVRTLLEVHLQVAVLIFVSGTLAEICGSKMCAWAIAAVVGVSVLFAIMQMLDVSAAWQARAKLGPFAKDEIRPTIVDRRPTGLSYSPIQLATQMCIAFGAIAAVRHVHRLRVNPDAKIDPVVLLAMAVLVIGSIAAGNRSPILGGMIFLVAYLARRMGWAFPLILTFGAAILYYASPYLLSFIQEEAPRVLRTDDNSAAARSVFAYYGTRLFLDNPLGYGFGFQPADMWQTYWSDLYMMRGSRGTRENMLHNYALSMINIYGVGLLLAAPLALRMVKRSSPYLVFFIPYGVHIMFHNSGPYFSDTLIWFAIAAIASGARSTDHFRQHKPDRWKAVPTGSG